MPKERQFGRAGGGVDIPARFELQWLRHYELMLLMKTLSIPLTGQIRIALPMQGSLFSAHFGGATQFRIIDADRDTRVLMAQTDQPAPKHIPGAFPKWLAEQGVQTVIAGSIGRRAVQLFSENGILVFTAQEGATAEELVVLQLEGRLTQPNIEECCTAHEHGHEHGSHAH